MSRIHARLRNVALAAAVLLAASHAAAASTQSPLAPHSVHASDTAGLAWILLGGGIAIFALVAAIATHAVARRAPDRTPRSHRALLLGGGIAFPSVVHLALLVYTAGMVPRLGATGNSPPLRVQVTGEMWWWRVHYVDEHGSLALATANELVIPTGQPVEIELRTADVIHSFWVPGLSGMLDAIPGRVNRLRFTAEVAGTLRGQCTEFCGLQHARMGLDVRVLDPAAYEDWYARQRTVASEPANPRLVRGRALFLVHCAACHTVRGTSAVASIGPDLTHLASRASIAASSFPNNPGTIAAWIASGQHLKPGNRMPEFPDLDGAELTALAQYVSSLQ
jgi:cytochrome c oxidase subunit 2